MSFDNSQTPSGELGIRRVVKPPPIDLASVEYIVSDTSIAEAWAKVRSNRGAPGVDNISIEKFPKWEKDQSGKSSSSVYWRDVTTPHRRFGLKFQKSPGEYAFWVFPV